MTKKGIFLVLREIFERGIHPLAYIDINEGQLNLFPEMF